ncbi:Glycosyltransferase [Rhynchospora pubera]|uniref:Glycosyltransferase n=1 Tax=Rhynchospora pubera TaxID=906938 RepID=A0AAV8EMB3_9POAL|nr:Glycosyltransferase [Rhynchospora pubera]
MGAGHLTPMVHLAKRFVEHGFSVTAAIADQPRKTGSTDATMSNLSMANPAISFHALPPVSFTPAKNNAIGIARQLGIPVYVFFASSASILASDVPETLLDRASEIYHTCLRNFTQHRKVDGILVNSFEALDPKAVKALKEGLCLPGHRMPLVDCIGPLITVGQEKNVLKRNECLNWLDSQPKRSVVFLSFGSAGAFTAKQINEIAIVLEKSGQRFCGLYAAQTIRKSFMYHCLIPI